MGDIHLKEMGSPLKINVRSLKQMNSQYSTLENENSHSDAADEYKGVRCLSAVEVMYLQETAEAPEKEGLVKTSYEILTGANQRIFSIVETFEFVNNDLAAQLNPYKLKIFEQKKIRKKSHRKEIVTLVGNPSNVGIDPEMFILLGNNCIGSIQQEEENFRSKMFYQIFNSKGERILEIFSTMVKDGESSDYVILENSIVIGGINKTWVHNGFLWNIQFPVDATLEHKVLLLSSTFFIKFEEERAFQVKPMKHRNSMNTNSFLLKRKSISQINKIFKDDEISQLGGGRKQRGASDPMRLTCPYCNNYVVTKTEKVPGVFAYLSGVLIALIPGGCFGCCLIPCLYGDTFLDTRHTCPKCHKTLGNFRNNAIC